MGRPRAAEARQLGEQALLGGPSLALLADGTAAADTPPSRAPLPWLRRWDEALAAYERKLKSSPATSPDYATALLGKMRCLASLAEWEHLNVLCKSWVAPSTAQPACLCPPGAACAHLVQHARRRMPVSVGSKRRGLQQAASW
jgi:hypothetical protein